MPPNEPCPHCFRLVMDWHNEWYNATERIAIYRGQAAMDCPLCRQAVLWFESRDIAAPSENEEPPVFQRSAILAAQWAPIREAGCVNLAGYLVNHPAGQQYGSYWDRDEIEQADQQVTNHDPHA